MYIRCATQPRLTARESCIIPCPLLRLVRLSFSSNFIFQWGCQACGRTCLPHGAERALDNWYSANLCAAITPHLHNWPRKYWDNYLNSSDQTQVNQTETMDTERGNVSTWEGRGQPGQTAAIWKLWSFFKWHKQGAAVGCFLTTSCLIKRNEYKLMACLWDIQIILFVGDRIAQSPVIYL